MGDEQKVNAPSGNGVKKDASSAGKSGGKPKKGMDLMEVYTLDDYTRWYKVYPYGFEFNSRSAKKMGDAASMRMWLPIRPSNLNITTHFATNVITTLYGVVEEHSNIRYYDIVISGTTGYAPVHAYPEKYPMKTNHDYKGGRKWFINKTITAKTGSQTVDKAINAAAKSGFMAQTVGIINTVANKVQSLVDSPDNYNGIKNEATGYVAFHSLYRMFHLYKRDAAGAGANTKDRRKVHPLQFLNYKDGIKYDVVPRTFTLTRSADSPMLYNYQIVLRAYNMRGIDVKTIKPGDRLKSLGLGGDESVKNDLMKKSSVAASVIGGLKSGLSVLGR